MADFEEALQALLADPAAMGQIMTLAQSLGAVPTAEEASEPTQEVLSQTTASDAPTEDAEPSPTEENQDAAKAPVFPFPDLGNLGNWGNLGNLGDLGTLTKLMGLFQQGNALDPEAAALLNALRPFLRPERQRKLDRAIRLAALSQTLRAAYALWKEGDLPV